MDLFGSRRKRKAFQEPMFAAAPKYQATAKPFAAEDEHEDEEEQIHSHAPTELDPESEPEAEEPPKPEAAVPLPLGAKVYLDHEKATLVMLHTDGRVEASVMENGESGFQMGKFPCGYVHESEVANDFRLRPEGKPKAQAKGKAKGKAKAKAEAVPEEAEEAAPAPVEPKSKAKAKGKAQEKPQHEPWELLPVEGPFTLQSYFRGKVDGKKVLIVAITKAKTEEYHKHICDLHKLAQDLHKAGTDFDKMKKLVIAKRQELHEGWQV
jgi:hypothetical protein